MDITWQHKAFKDLGLDELYDILALRQAVFVVEQDCPYQDADGDYDKKGFHLSGRNKGGELLAYARILPAGLAYDEVAIGRILTAESARRSGLGKKLMYESFRQIDKQFGKSAIRISAQCYLEKFYTDLGFEPTGKEYLEDGIPHMEMLKPSLV